MKHIKLFEQFCSSLNEGLKSRRPGLNKAKIKHMTISDDIDMYNLIDALYSNARSEYDNLLYDQDNRDFNTTTEDNLYHYINTEFFNKFKDELYSIIHPPTNLRNPEDYTQWSISDVKSYVKEIVNDIIKDKSRIFSAVEYTLSKFKDNDELDRLKQDVADARNRIKELYREQDLAAGMNGRAVDDEFGNEWGGYFNDANDELELAKKELNDFMKADNLKSFMSSLKSIYPVVARNFVKEIDSDYLNF